MGEPGNACNPHGDDSCHGTVEYDYWIGTFEVTNSQYAEFLNAIAAADPNEVFNSGMGPCCFVGGIQRSGSSGSYTYSITPGREDMPVSAVRFFDAVRFANWLHNGKPTGAQTAATTEDGAYTLNGADPPDAARNPGATVVVPSEDEWYKAAYYDAQADAFTVYPTHSDVEPTCDTPGASANRANCDGAVLDFTAVGGYTGSASAYGTFDQAGNVSEWTEALFTSHNGTIHRGMRGGSYFDPAFDNGAESEAYSEPANLTYTFGFRVAMLPEPDAGLLVVAALLGLATWRGKRA